MTRPTQNRNARAGPWRSLWRMVGAVCLISGLLTFVASPAGASLVYYSKDYSEMGHVWNTMDGICSAAANINSFVYLINHFPGVYGDTDLVADLNGNKVIEYSEQVSARDLMAWGWTSPTGIPRMGIYGGKNSGNPRRIWESTYWWFEDFAPGTSVLDGQAVEGGMSYWVGGTVLEPGYPKWDFLWDSLYSGLDVELGVKSTTTTLAHALTLTGMAFDDLNGDGLWDDGETPKKIGFLDPNLPTQLTWADVTLNPNVLDRLEFIWWQNGETFNVYRAFTEGPALIPGDATGDGIVDELDAARLAANWGLGDATWAMGDFDGDDFVSAADAAILAANWGQGSTGAAAAASLPVPEPSIGLLLLGILSACFARPTRR